VPDTAAALPDTGGPDASAGRDASASSPDTGASPSDAAAASLDGPPPSSLPLPYRIDVALPGTGSVVVSHNALLAFPFDLAAASPLRIRTATALGPGILEKVQTLGYCTADKTAEDPSIRGIESNLAAAHIGAGTSGAVEWLSLNMPYDTMPPDGFTRRPTTFCLGWRTPDGAWHWRLTPVTPTFDDAERVARGLVSFHIANADAMAVLFDVTTVVRSLSVGLHRPGEEAPWTPSSP
jgi:hypothetical protein